MIFIKKYLSLVRIYAVLITTSLLIGFSSNSWAWLEVLNATPYTINISVTPQDACSTVINQDLAPSLSSMNSDSGQISGNVEGCNLKVTFTSSGVTLYNAIVNKNNVVYSCELKNNGKGYTCMQVK